MTGGTAQAKEAGRKEAGAHSEVAGKTKRSPNRIVRGSDRCYKSH